MDIGGSVAWRNSVLGVEEEKGGGVGGRDGFGERSLRSLIHRRLVFPVSN